MASEKQGHLGSLSEKTAEELHDLLRRQETLTRNKKFIQRLPDKGEKIMILVERLKQELKQREKVDETADLFHKMALNAAKARLQDGNETEEQEHERKNTLQQIINTGERVKMVVDERVDQDPQMCNTYQKAIQKSETKPEHKAKFYPNRTARTSNVSDVKKELVQSINKSERDIISLDGSPSIVDQSQDSTNNVQNSCSSSNDSSSKDTDTNSRLQPVSHKNSVDDKDSEMNVSMSSQGSPHKTLQDIGVEGQGLERLKYRYDESLELSAYTPPVRHQGAQVVSLQESFQLLKNQTDRLEKLHTEHAAEKLATRLGVNLVNPEGSTLHKYREVADIDSEGSSDEENEEDYLD